MIAEDGAFCRYIPDERAMVAFGKELVSLLKVADVVLLDGPLGAGKTTLVRGLLTGLDYHGAVRSPTFNLIQTFETNPPVMHADLYRLKGSLGIGLEDYLDTHLCLLEWPDRALDLISPEECWRVRIAFHEEGRDVTVTPPGLTEPSVK